MYIVSPNSWRVLKYSYRSYVFQSVKDTIDGALSGGSEGRGWMVGSPAGSATSESLPVSLSSDQLSKLRADLDILQTNMTVFGEMINEMTPGSEHPEDLQLFQVNFIQSTALTLDVYCFQIGRLNFSRLLSSSLDVCFLECPWVYPVAEVFMFTRWLGSDHISSCMAWSRSMYCWVYYMICKLDWLSPCRSHSSQ